jgi:hypothetical protein
MLKSTTTAKGAVTPTLVPRLQLCSTLHLSSLIQGEVGSRRSLLIYIENVCKALINTTNNNTISTKLPITFSLTHVQLQYQDQSAAC